MAFKQMNTLMAKRNAGSLRGTVYPIACKTWFTSNGSIMPLSLKFEGEDGILYRVADINTTLVEDKNYSGIPSREFSCKAVIGGLMQEFKLIFYVEEYRWVMVV